MWSCAKTLEGIESVQKGSDDEIIIRLKPHADPEMIVKTICFKINKVYAFTMYAAFKETLARKMLPCTQAFKEAIEKCELRIQIPPYISPGSITFFHIGKRGLKITYPIRQ